jgi:hypothetical protein
VRSAINVRQYASRNSKFQLINFENSTLLDPGNAKLPKKETDKLKELYQRFLNAVDEQAMTVDWTKMPSRFMSRNVYRKHFSAFEDHQRHKFFRLVGYFKDAVQTKFGGVSQFCGMTENVWNICIWWPVLFKKKLTLASVGSV